MKFVADAMLGDVARWLRVLGYDTTYAGGSDDDAILELARKENRTVVSRDRELCRRSPGSICLGQVKLREQLVSIARLHQPDSEQILSRCIECNIPLRKATKESVAGKVPEPVRSRTGEFWNCPGCGKAYWRGSHYDKMLAEAKDILAQCESK